jgi:hypothetical protein
MHFLFNLLRTENLYMFRALLAHPQEELHSGTWYIACVLCQLAIPGLEWNTPVLVQPTDITRTQYTNCPLCSASWRWASNARKMQRLLVRNKLNKKCIMFFFLIEVRTVCGFWSAQQLSSINLYSIHSSSNSWSSLPARPFSHHLPIYSSVFLLV